MSARMILTPEEKISIIREHLIEKVAVSELCDKHGISVVNFYNWQKQPFENGAVAFSCKTNAANAKRQDDTAPGQFQLCEATMATTIISSIIIAANTRLFTLGAVASPACKRSVSDKGAGELSGSVTAPPSCKRLTIDSVRGKFSLISNPAGKSFAHHDISTAFVDQVGRYQPLPSSA